MNLWRDYSEGYVKNNRASGVSIRVAALTASFLLSFLCSMFYNFWDYDVKQIIREEGSWQGRLTGEIKEDGLFLIENFANVKSITLNEALSGEKETVVDITFQDARRIFQDMPLLASQLGLEEDAADYHTVLLSKYLIHDPADETPPLLLSFYLAVLIMVSISLILIIRGSFAMSMNARIHQFGIFSSVGATPKQIRACLMQEALMLCGWPVLAGTFGGILGSMLLRMGVNLFTARIPGAFVSEWVYHPGVFAVTFLSSAITVLFSAWLPAGKLSRMTPLEAIRNTGGLQLKRKKSSPVLGRLFGVEGELAGAALKAQKRAMRTAALSLTLSFLGFTLILCFFTLSGISTNYTYFERYQDAWDVMAAIHDAAIEDLEAIEELKRIPGAEDVVVYQKAEAVCRIPQKEISGELDALGGPSGVAGAEISPEGDCWRVKTPIMILDDESFAAYCQRAGTSGGKDGVVLLNRIWDSKNSNFRYPVYVPFVEETQGKIALQDNTGESLEIPVLGGTEETPLLREEYQDYTLPLFMPLSLWRELSGEIGGAEAEVYVRVLADGAETAEELTALEQELKDILGQRYEVELENRIQEKLTNDDMILGYQFILGGLCVILAFIGIANVFSNTLGFLRLRKREFARYMSVGMTPGGMRKMFCIEALVTAGRPLFVTLPLTALAVAFMIKASYLNPMEFIAEAPVLPMTVFFLVILGFVALAYYLGGKKIMRYHLTEALRDDTIV